MQTTTIDLEKFRTKGSKVFTGRARGIKIRNELRLDNLINEFDMVEILIPVDVMSINPSFLEEFLFNTVKKLGKPEFMKRVSFLSESNRYNISEDLEEAIDRILRKENALSKKIN